MPASYKNILDAFPIEDGESYRQYATRVLPRIKEFGLYVQDIKVLADCIRRTHQKYTPEFQVVRQTKNAAGTVMLTTERLVVHDEIEDKSDFEAAMLTTNPYGGQWVRYIKKPVDTTEILARLDQTYKDFKPPKFTKKYRQSEQNVAVINMFDAHLDKVAVKAEVGYESTLKDNIDRYVSIFDELLLQVQVRKPERIIFPIGSDLFHTNAGNRTKKGTIIQYLCSELDAYEAICNTQIECLYKLLDVAPVYIPFVKGNHDEDKVNTMAYWIDKMFGSYKHCTIDKSRLQRKYFHYGNNLLAFAHGDKEKSVIDRMPLYMAEEAPEYWSGTIYRKFYLGDLHHNFEYKFMKSKDFVGCNVEFLRSVGVSDGWHNDFGYIGIPITGEAHIWDKNEGNIADLKANRQGVPAKNAGKLTTL